MWLLLVLLVAIIWVPPNRETISAVVNWDVQEWLEDRMLCDGGRVQGWCFGVEMNIFPRALVQGGVRIGVGRSCVSSA